MLNEGSNVASSLEAWFVEAVARQARLAPAAIGTDMPVTAFGVSSLGLIRLARELSDRVGRDLGNYWLWEHPSIRAAVEAAIVAPAAPAARGGASVASGRIALSGLACRFPGAANADEFWKLLQQGGQSVSRIPASRLALNPALAELSDETAWAGLIEDIDHFDPEFFGISPVEARQMDPQQRLALELCWEALEDAGVLPGSLEGRRVGVFWGAWRGDYASLLAKQRPLGSHSATGSDLSVVAGRISYALGLQGPSLTVATACSSSLVAVHLARRCLLSGEADLALVGGSNVLLDPVLSRELQQLGALSPRGRCSSFDESADGYVRAEGVGAIVLQREADALRAGARAYCVLLGSAVNNDGASNGLTAPNPAAQRAVIEAACRDAGVAPASVEYVEAHGTGTPLGDPIEASALRAVLGPGRDADAPLLIGSVKANIGHAEAAAGIAGLIKVALSIHHGEIPGTPSQLGPSSRIDFGGGQLQVSAEPRRFRQPSRRAGVSSFGFSGTNAHVIAEAAIAGEPISERAALGLAVVEECRASAPVVAFVFDGQGGHWAGMGRQLLASAPVFRSALLECDAVLEAHVGRSIMDELCAGVVSADLLGRWSAQLALQHASSAWCKSIGLTPSCVIGHSIGEVGAALFSGALTLREAAHVMHELAVAAGRVGAEVAMLAVEASETEVSEWLALAPELEIAALNGPDQTVVVGPRAELARLAQRLEPSRAHHFVDGAGVHGRWFDASSMDLAGLSGRQPKLPFFSSSVGGAAGPLLSPEHWKQLLGRPVRFAAAIEQAMAAGADTFIELGPHGSLQRAISSCAAGRNVSVLSLLARGVNVAMGPELRALSSGEGSGPAAAGSRPKLVSVTARDARGLDRACARMQRLLEAEGSEARFDDICHTSNLRRTQHARRVAVVARSASAAARALEERRRQGVVREAGGVAFYYSGDGGQWTGMGLRLAEVDPVFAEALERCDRVTRQVFDWALIERLQRAAESESSEARQPLLVAIQLALTECLRAKGVEPAMVAGNSLGEIAAAFAAGALDLEGAMHVSLVRGQLLARFSGSGGMALVQLPPEECSALWGGSDELGIAIEYSRSSVVAGAEPALAAFVERMKGAGVFCRRVNVSVAGHTPMLEPVARDLVRALTGVSFRDVQRPMWSTSLDRWLSASDVGAEYFGQSLCSPVRARGAVRGLLARGARAIVEIGPHPVLQRSIEEILEESRVSASVLACMKRDEEPLQTVYEALAGAFEHGAGIDWAAVTPPGRVVALPAYPWNHRSYWVEPRSEQTSSSPAPAPSEPSIAYQLSWERAELVARAPHGPRRYVLFADEGGLAAAVREALVSSGHRATLVYQGRGFVQRAEDVFEAGLDRADYAALADRLNDAHVEVVTCWPLALEDEVADPAASIGALCEHLCGIGSAWAGRARAAAVVTRGAVPAAGTLRSAAGAAVWAFARSLELEWHLPVGRIDLDVEPAAADRRHVIDALAALGSGEEWAFRRGASHRSRLVRSEASNGALAVHSDGVYWIVGGLGHVGLAFAEWLVSAGARHLLLSSRTDRSFEAHVAPRLARLRASGAAVEVEPLDITDAGRVGLLRRRYGSRLRGVVHAAGLISHVPVERLTRGEIESVLRSKVDGVLALSAACPPGELDFFILFSSAAATWGASGLAHYAAANRFLDAVATLRGRDALSVGWGRWSGGGMVSADQEALFDRIGLRPLEPSSAFRVLGAAHARRQSHVVIADADWSRLGAALHGRTRTELCAQLAGTSAIETASRSPASPRFDDWSASKDAERGRKIERFLEQKVRALLELDADVDVGRDTGLFDLGVDSVLSVRLAANLSGELGVRLSPTAVLENANIRKLAAHVWRAISAAGGAPRVQHDASDLHAELERELMDCNDA